MISLMSSQSDMPADHGMAYLKPLDGIRALAIIAVLIFHVSASALPGGFVGVDVFFVLSGYLITSILLHDLRGGRFKIGEFYLRRIQRLLPNVVVLVATVIMLWVLLMPPTSTAPTARHGLWALCSLSNIYIWKYLGGYWGDGAEMAPLTHTWSLGIEEQFYLLFPLLLLILAIFQRRRIFAWLLMLMLGSFTLCLLGSYSKPETAFYLLPHRAWELLCGACYASTRVSFHEATPRSFSLPEPLRGLMGWLGLGLILSSFWLAGQSFRFPGWIALMPTLGPVLLIVSIAEGQSAMSRFLSAPLMVGVGKVSYSLYLWHWPLILLGKAMAVRSGLSELTGAVIGGVIGILFGLVAYRWIEQPLRNRGPGRGRRLVVIASGFASVILLCSLLANPRRRTDPEHRFDPIAFEGNLYNAGRPTDPALFTATVRYQDVSFPSLSDRPQDAWRTGGIQKLHGGGKPSVVVFGSSHALMYSALIDSLCRELKLSVAFFGADAGTPVFFETPLNPNFSSIGEAHEFDEARKRWLREWRPAVVIAIDKWDDWVSKPGGFDNRLRSFLQEVTPLCQRVLFVTQVPMLAGGDEVNFREWATSRMGKGKQLPKLGTGIAEQERRTSTQIAESLRAEFPSLRVVRTDELFLRKDGSVRYASGRKFFYADDDHLSDKGIEETRELFHQGLSEVLLKR